MCLVEQVKTGSVASKALDLNQLRKCIPEECFKKSILRSSWYMFFDYAMWFGSVFALITLKSSSLWETMPQWQQILATVIYWQVSGFFMWCIFVVGHDCGHGTFSDYEWLNDIIGHITHGSILVPYWPWQLSHRRHHMHHNHIDNDYSHPWYTPDKLEKPDEDLARLMDKYPFVRFFFPFVGWPLYLYGMPDGSHLFPFKNQRLWKEFPDPSSAQIEYNKCIISAVVVVINFYAALHLCGHDWSTFLTFYVVPWLVFSWWLVSVTYLQHHDHDTVVYDDDNWKFVTAAFETVDRKYGYGLDTFSHHITDGHVVHHLFFTKIPHYNLPTATNSLKAYLKEHNLERIYKFEETYDFMFRVHSYLVKFGLSATRATRSDSHYQSSAVKPADINASDVSKAKTKDTKKSK